MTWTPERRLLAVAAAVLVLDQLTKWIVSNILPLGRELAVLPGFFSFCPLGQHGRGLEPLPREQHRAGDCFRSRLCSFSFSPVGISMRILSRDRSRSGSFSGGWPGTWSTGC